jgi:phosphopantetheinyl transferase
VLSGTRKKLAERFFSAEENEQISKSECAAEEFFIIWTKKEAYAKQCGRGLSKILAEGQDDMRKKLHFSCFELSYKGERYILTVCTEQDTHTTIKAPETCEVREIVRI